MDQFDRILRVMERVCSGLAAAMLLAIMLIATLDVAMRYFLNSPLGWSYDLISLYLMAGMFFLAMSGAAPVPPELWQWPSVCVGLATAGVMLAATAFSLIVPGIQYGNQIWPGWGVYVVAAGVLAARLDAFYLDRQLQAAAASDGEVDTSPVRTSRCCASPVAQLATIRSRGVSTR